MAKREKPSGGELSISMPAYGPLMRPEQTEEYLELQGMRYGNPDGCRYATGRYDGKAPDFPWPAGCNNEAD